MSMAYVALDVHKKTISLTTALQTTNSHEYTPIAASWREDGSHLLGEGDQEAQHEISSCSLVSIRGSTAVFGLILSSDQRDTIQTLVQCMNIAGSNL